MGVGTGRKWMAPLLLAAGGLAATVPACSRAPEPDRETAREAYFRDLLFTNNPTGRTYYASHAIGQVFIEGDCVSMSAGDARMVATYRKHGVTAFGLGIDGYRRPGYKIQELVVDILSGAPLSILENFPQARRKQRGGDIICYTPLPERVALDRPVAIRLTRDRAAFDRLWSEPAPRFGYRSPARGATPNCHVAVRASPTNEVLATRIDVLMPAFDYRAFRSPSFLGCLVRGTVAAFGVPGVLSKPDDVVLRGDVEEALHSQLRKSSYWDPFLVGAAYLYDGPGWTWPQVRAEWRRLEPLQADDRGQAQ